MTANGPAGSARQRIRLGWFHVIGGLLALAALGAVIARVAGDWHEVRTALNDAELSWLLLAAGAAGSAMTTIAVLWRQVLRALDVEVAVADTVARYYVGELGKYVPGGVWPVIGRGELAVRAGVRRSAAYASVALSLVVLYIAGAGVALIGLASSADRPWLRWAPPAVLVLGVAALHPRLLRALLRVAERLLRRRITLAVPRWRTSVTLVLAYVPVWVLVGTSTWAVARAFDPSAGWWRVTGAAALSWLVGFLLVPAPGGVGVREATFVAAATTLDPAIAATTALVARLLFVVTDVVGAAVGARVSSRPDPRAADRRPGSDLRADDRPGEG
ncbi:MAG: lysylphosphatidylglycerol synthase transmembrane domain-containing protein [Acidimicrobiales bacterium]